MLLDASINYKGKISFESNERDYEPILRVQQPTHLGHRLIEQSFYTHSRYHKLAH